MSEDNILDLDVVTPLGKQVDRVFSQAAKSGLSDVIVIGWNDEEFYFNSSLSDGGDALWLLESAKKRLLRDV